jgi:hypothetical protein
MLNQWREDTWFQQNSLSVLAAARALSEEDEEQLEVPDPEVAAHQRIIDQQEGFED